MKEESLIIPEPNTHARSVEVPLRMLSPTIFLFKFDPLPTLLTLDFVLTVPLGTISILIFAFAIYWLYGNIKKKYELTKFRANGTVGEIKACKEYSSK